MQIKKGHLALICISFGWFLVLSGRYGISILVKSIESSLSIGHAEIGLALTSMWLFYGLMQFPSGLISDIKGRKISILVSIITFAFAFLLIGLSTHYIMFFITVILLGIGTGGFPTAGIAMITDIFKEKRGKALGIQSSAGSLVAVVPVIVSVIIAFYTWRLFFFIWAGLSFVAAILFFRYTSESTRLPDVVSLRHRFKQGAEVFREKKILLMFIVNLVLSFTWIGLMSFYPTYLIEEKLFTGFQAGLALSLLSAGGIVLKPVTGSLSDKYNRKAIILLLVFISGLMTLLLIFLNSLWLIFLVSFLLASTSTAFPIISSYLMGLWEAKGRGGRLGFYRSVLIMLGSPTSAFIGISAARYGFNVPFLIIALLLFLMVIILFVNLLYERYIMSRQIAT